MASFDTAGQSEDVDEAIRKVDRPAGERQPKRELTLDMDRSVSETHGEQEGGGSTKGIGTPLCQGKPGADWKMDLQTYGAGGKS